MPKYPKNSPKPCDCIENGGFVRLDKVLKMIPVSRSTWWDGCKSGRFPKAYKLGARTTAWRIKDILECIDRFQCG
jgi:prophage regulatory protein